MGSSFLDALAATPLQGLVLGLLALPVCVWAAYTDLSRMKIRNGAVVALFAVFVVAGPFVMETASDYLWRYAHLGIVLVIGFVLSSLRLLGAGDAKFAAAMAPFVAAPDVPEVLLLFAVLLIATWSVHRLLRRVAFVRRATPGWASWDELLAFPLGITLGATLVAYLALAAAT